MNNLTENRFKELLTKKDFVMQMSDLSVKYGLGAARIDYDVFFVNDELEEYLVVTFEGGKQTVRNCRANSELAILEEIPKLIFGYDDEIEVSYYKQLKQKSVNIDGLSC